MSLFLSLFMQVVMGIRIQQLYISKMRRNGKSVEYYSTKNKVEKVNSWLNMQNMTNLKLFSYQKVSLAMLWRFLMITKFLMGWINISQLFFSCISSYLPHFGLISSDHRVNPAIYGHFYGVWVRVSSFVGVQKPIIIPYVLFSAGELKGCTPLQWQALACCAIFRPLLLSRAPKGIISILKGAICAVLWVQRKIFILWLLLGISFRSANHKQSSQVGYSLYSTQGYY